MPSESSVTEGQRGYRYQVLWCYKYGLRCANENRSCTELRGTSTEMSQSRANGLCAYVCHLLWHSSWI